MLEWEEGEGGGGEGGGGGKSGEGEREENEMVTVHVTQTWFVSRHRAVISTAEDIGINKTMLLINHS